MTATNSCVVLPVANNPSGSDSVSALLVPWLADSPFPTHPRLDVVRWLLVHGIALASIMHPDKGFKDSGWGLGREQAQAARLRQKE